MTVDNIYKYTLINLGCICEARHKMETWIASLISLSVQKSVTNNNSATQNNPL